MGNPNHTYLLDANVFIQAYRLYYAFDLAPGFWSKLAIHAQDGQVKSVDRVLDEINMKDDELKKWTNREFGRWFEDTRQQDVLGAYASIIGWAQKESYKERAKKDFAQANNADAWVVAHALAKGFIVVTQERYNAEIKRKIPIPNVCHKFGIRCLNTFEMMRELNMTIN